MPLVINCRILFDLYLILLFKTTIFRINVSVRKLPDYDYQLIPDLASLLAAGVRIVPEINWKNRLSDEIEKAFGMSTTTLLIHHKEVIIAFGRIVRDGRYYVILADAVVDPVYKGRGLGKYLVTALNNQLKIITLLI